MFFGWVMAASATVVVGVFSQIVLGLGSMLAIVAALAYLAGTCTLLNKVAVTCFRDFVTGTNMGLTVIGSYYGSLFQDTYDESGTRIYGPFGQPHHVLLGLGGAIAIGLLICLLFAIFSHFNLRPSICKPLGRKTEYPPLSELIEEGYRLGKTPRL